MVGWLVLVVCTYVLLYVTLEGVALRAKMNQQRTQ
jgi:5'-3' exonuclease